MIRVIQISYLTNPEKKNNSSKQASTDLPKEMKEMNDIIILTYGAYPPLPSPPKVRLCFSSKPLLRTEYYSTEYAIQFTYLTYRVLA